MNIVLEGPDGAGKSTLAALLAQATGMKAIQGNGPPKSKDEFYYRCIRYLGYTNVIFDRTPFISEAVYAPVFGRKSEIDSGLLSDFWATRPFVVYVRPTTRHLASHHKSEHETQEHFDGVVERHGAICDAYDEKMLRIAHYIHRRTDTHLAPMLRAFIATKVRQVELMSVLGRNYSPIYCSACGYSGLAREGVEGDYAHMTPGASAPCTHEVIKL